MIAIGGVWLLVTIVCGAEPACRPATLQRVYPSMVQCLSAATAIRKQHPQAFVACDGAPR